MAARALLTSGIFILSSYLNAGHQSLVTGHVFYRAAKICFSRVTAECGLVSTLRPGRAGMPGAARAIENWPSTSASHSPISAAIMTGAKDAAAAKALVDFLRTPESAKVIKAKGLEPATP